MNEEVLDSIIAITGQRDTGSLEYSLVSTVAELVKTDNVSLFKLVNSIAKLRLEYIIRLDTVSEGELAWSIDQETIECNQHARQCIFSRTSLLVTESDEETLYIPIFGVERPVGLMRVQGRHLNKSELLIRGLLKIYQNYLIILSESEQDKLTGLLNRKTFETKLGKWHKQDKCSSEHSEWLVMVDIDHFKAVNDNYGHVCGDEVLLTLSQQMQNSFPGNELLFRFGGEEFVMVLRGMTLLEVERELEKFRAKIAKHKFPFIDSLTISMGFVERLERDYPITLLDQADKALYYGKQNGRNCVHNYTRLVALGEIVEADNDSDVELF